MNLDPQIAELIEALDAGFPPVHTMTGAEARAIIRSRFVPAVQPEHVAEVFDTTISGPDRPLALRIYRPAAAGPLPIVIYAHGGGFVFCDLDSHDGLCRSLANLTSGRGDFGRIPAGTREPLARCGRRRLRGDPVGSRQCDADLGADTTRIVTAATARAATSLPSPR